MLHVGHAVHERKPDETLRRVSYNVEEHVEHHPLLHQQQPFTEEETHQHHKI